MLTGKENDLEEATENLRPISEDSKSRFVIPFHCSCG